LNVEGEDYRPAASLAQERGRYVIPLDENETSVVLRFAR
jgi:hypothetical protein